MALLNKINFYKDAKIYIMLLSKKFQFSVSKKFGVSTTLHFNCIIICGDTCILEVIAI